MSESNIILFSGDNSDGGYSSKSVYLGDIRENYVIKEIEFSNEVNDILFRTNALIVSYGYHVSFFNSCNFNEVFSKMIFRFKIDQK